MGILMDYLSESQGVWRCVAGAVQRSYVIESFDQQARQLSLAIYNSPQIDPQKLVEVVQLTIDDDRSQGIGGQGTTQTGQVIKIRAFQQTVDFVVDDPVSGSAVGVCTYLSDWQ